MTKRPRTPCADQKSAMTRAFTLVDPCRRTDTGSDYTAEHSPAPLERWFIAT